jgi:hypothetical protein
MGSGEEVAGLHEIRQDRPGIPEERRIHPVLAVLTAKTLLPLRVFFIPIGDALIEAIVERDVIAALVFRMLPVGRDSPDFSAHGFVSVG